MAEARAAARAQQEEAARLNAALEAAQLDVAQLRRELEVQAARPQQGGDDRPPLQQPPPAFAFPTKVNYPELTKLTRKAFEAFRLEYRTCKFFSSHFGKILSCSSFCGATIELKLRVRRGSGN